MWITDLTLTYSITLAIELFFAHIRRLFTFRNENQTVIQKKLVIVNEVRVFTKAKNPETTAFLSPKALFHLQGKPIHEENQPLKMQL